jgi:glycosyltransferase involved in cell wall biosynthesis
MIAITMTLTVAYALGNRGPGGGIVFYVSADVFCFPSKTDTFGIVMIEAMSLGCPVAGYPVAGPIDVIESDVNGYMDENFENAILKCLSLDRHKVYVSSFKWTWENCWKIFKENLVHK